VAKGFTQIKRIDYKEKFSPMMRFTYIRLLLALTAHFDLQLFEMDVKIAFLNGNFKEQIYVDQPICFVSKVEEDKACHLDRCMYGLK